MRYNTPLPHSNKLWKKLENEIEFSDKKYLVSAVYTTESTLRRILLKNPRRI
jgi:hypothetical protein